MPVRPSVEQLAQFGPESVAGQAVAATHRPSSGTLTISPKPVTERIRPSGSYFDSLVYQKTQDVEGSFEGTPSWTEIGDYLRLIFGAPTTEAGPAEDTYRHTYQLGPIRPTWTVEMGDSVSAARSTGVFATGFELAFDANGGDASLKIDLKGNQLEDGVPLSSGVTSVTPQPIRAASVSVFVADTLSGLDGATPLDGGLKQTLKASSIADLVRFFGSTATVNSAPDATFELVSEADVVGRGFLSDLQSSATRYVRISAFGTVLATTPTFVSQTLTVDLAVQVENHDRGDEAAVYAATNTFRWVTDANGFSHRVTLLDDNPA